MWTPFAYEEERLNILRDDSFSYRSFCKRFSTGCSIYYYQFCGSAVEKGVGLLEITELYFMFYGIVSLSSGKDCPFHPLGKPTSQSKLDSPCFLSERGKPLPRLEPPPLSCGLWLFPVNLRPFLAISPTALPFLLPRLHIDLSPAS